MFFVGFNIPVVGKWPEKKVQFCLFVFQKIWPKFYEKQRYNLEWPNQYLDSTRAHVQTFQFSGTTDIFKKLKKSFSLYCILETVWNSNRSRF